MTALIEQSELQISYRGWRIVLVPRQTTGYQLWSYKVSHPIGGEHPCLLNRLKREDAIADAKQDIDRLKLILNV